MSSLIQSYIRSIQSEFNTGQSTEHSFRSALKTLLESLNPKILALNESQRIVGVGMPDFTIKDSKNNTINIWRIEAKDLYVDLDEKKNSDQLGRYLSAFDNFIYTNNLTFTFYRNGKKVDSVSLGNCDKKTITWTTSDLFADNSVKLERLLIDFLSYSGQTITSPEKLARAMAQKAQLIKYAIQNIFAQDGTDSLLYNQLLSFQDLLVHDLTPDQFADMYAQTIAYGLFAARLHDPTLPNFSREEASKLIPKTNPFIRWLFKDILNNDDLDEGLAHIIDDLVHIFLHCNVDEILHTYGRGTQMQDPIIHFYETFLWEYDANMRKKRGVYYTPDPVVQFIVRGVDHLLKSEFGLSRWLADTSKIEHTFTEQEKKIKKQVHRVQLLDPATGTGTFLNETIKYIHAHYFAWQDGIRSGYVTTDLLPRIRGFEILMASYTMAHLKLGLTLADTGRTGEDRFNIYLTNSLEQPHDHIWSLFSQQLARESEEASRIKKEQPIMIVMGNPPYSGESSNNGDYIMKLMEDYKKEPWWMQKLQEQNSKWINDDYVKFIRFAKSFIEKNNEGIIGYICPHGFLDNPTFRGMRWKILDTFDSIYTVDLHGNSKKKETTPDWWIDQNVFDIMQGVAITFFVKTGNKKKWALATVYHTDLYGKREVKYDWLLKNSLDTIDFKKLENIAPNYFMVQKDFGLQKKYDSFVSVSELFNQYSLWILTKKDKFITDISKEDLLKRLTEVWNKQISISDIATKYDLKIRDNDNRDLELARNKLFDSGIDIQKIKKVWYRIFENRYVYYDEKFVARLNTRIFNNFLWWENISLVCCRQLAWNNFYHAFVSQKITDQCYISTKTKEWWSVFPLYLYNEGLDGEQMRSVNMDMTIVQEICDGLGMRWDPSALAGTSVASHIKALWKGGFTGDAEAPLVKGGRGDIWPEDIFDYIYAVLHSTTYRETYKEFLKIDFPRVPFTKDKDLFWKLVDLGRELRLRHLMEHPQSEELITTYPIGWDNTVEKITYTDAKVWINATQYFDNVPQIAREFYIGGYQPAQKWLKDRKGKILSYEDIMHYQKIIVALTNTARVMEEIDIVWITFVTES
jgi:predicted helicase